MVLGIIDLSLNVILALNFTVDIEKPVIQCPENITKFIEPPDTPEVDFEFPNATDNSGFTEPVECSHKDGAEFPLGETQVVCSTEDASDNSASCSFFVDVEGI